MRIEDQLIKIQIALSNDHRERTRARAKRTDRTGEEHQEEHDTRIKTRRTKRRRRETIVSSEKDSEASPLSAQEVEDEQLQVLEGEELLEDEEEIYDSNESMNVINVPLPSLLIKYSHSLSPALVF